MSATISDSTKNLAYALLEFVDGARCWGIASALHDNKTCRKTIQRMETAEQTILDTTGDIDVLLPLLDHESASVRLQAAASLLGDHRDAAVATLQELDLSEDPVISWFGGLYLQLVGVPNTGSGFKPPVTDPHDFPPKRRPKKEATT